VVHSSFNTRLVTPSHVTGHKGNLHRILNVDIPQRETVQMFVSDGILQLSLRTSKVNYW